ncbi:hypothetical protein AOLI_G00141160 [Acnodon oligacanthus]
MSLVSFSPVSGREKKVRALTGFLGRHSVCACVDIKHRWQLRSDLLAPGVSHSPGTLVWPKSEVSQEPRNRWESQKEREKKDGERSMERNQRRMNKDEGPVRLHSYSSHAFSFLLLH